VDVGQRISYMALEKGVPVFSSDGYRIGAVHAVLAAEDEDVFDGLVLSVSEGPSGHRFADADQIAEIGELGVALKLDREECASLPVPSANPAVLRVDPGEPHSGALESKLRRAWDYISGKY
jgi:hypothetical protein